MSRNVQLAAPFPRHVTFHQSEGSISSRAFQDAGGRGLLFISDSALLARITRAMPPKLGNGQKAIASALSNDGKEISHAAKSDDSREVPGPRTGGFSKWAPLGLDTTSAGARASRSPAMESLAIRLPGTEVPTGRRVETRGQGAPNRPRSGKLEAPRPGKSSLPARSGTQLS
jgi:hypothetical protein